MARVGIHIFVSNGVGNFNTGSFRIPFNHIRYQFEQWRFQTFLVEHPRYVRQYLYRSNIYAIYFFRHSQQAVQALDECDKFKCVSVLFKPHKVSSREKALYDLIVYDSPLHRSLQYSPSLHVTLRLTERIPPRFLLQLDRTITKVDSIQLCFAGWSKGGRLNQLVDRLSHASTVLNAMFNITLTFVSELGHVESKSQTRLGFPVFFVPFQSFGQSLEVLKVCDVGLVPHVDQQRLDRYFKFGFKDSLNAGRAMLFAQLGVPFVSDPEYELFELLGKANVSPDPFIAVGPKEWTQKILSWIMMGTNGRYLVKHVADKVWSVETESWKLLKKVMNIYRKKSTKAFCIFLNATNEDKEMQLMQQLMANQLDNPNLKVILSEGSYFASLLRTLMISTSVFFVSCIYTCSLSNCDSTIYYP